MRYAYLEDVEASWREVADFERERFDRVLEDAGTWLDAQLLASGRAPESVPLDALRMVSVNLLRRCVGELDPTSDGQNWTTYTDQYAQAAVPARVGGDFYLTKWERSMLGIGRGRAGFSA